MHISIGIQIASFVGAALILVAYVGHQMKWMDSDRPWYNVLNAIGSGILGYIAFRPFQVGFVVLETAWAVVSLYALMRAFRRQRTVAEET